MRSLPWVLVFLGPLAHAADPDSGNAGRFSSLTIESGRDTAWVFVDSVRVGTTPCTRDSLAPGFHRLRLVQTDLSSWLTGTINDTIHLTPGEQRKVQYFFDRRTNLITDPSGATVWIGDSIAGTTPLLISSAPGQELPERVTVEKSGFEKAVVPIVTAQGGTTFVVLKKIWQSVPPDGPLTPEVSGGRSSVKLYVAGGVALLSGVATAYFKIKADGLNQQYQETGNPSFRNDMQKLDTAAAISLVITQIGFAFLSYFLLSD